MKNIFFTIAGIAAICGQLSVEATDERSTREKNPSRVVSIELRSDVLALSDAIFAKTCEHIFGEDAMRIGDMSRSEEEFRIEDEINAATLKSGTFEEQLQAFAEAFSKEKVARAIKIRPRGHAVVETPLDFAVKNGARDIAEVMAKFANVKIDSDQTIDSGLQIRVIANIIYDSISNIIYDRDWSKLSEKEDNLRSGELDFRKLLQSLSGKFSAELVKKAIDRKGFYGYYSFLEMPMIAGRNISPASPMQVAIDFAEKGEEEYIDNSRKEISQRLLSIANDFVGSKPEV